MQDVGQQNVVLPVRMKLLAKVLRVVQKHLLDFAMKGHSSVQKARHRNSDEDLVRGKQFVGYQSGIRQPVFGFEFGHGQILDYNSLLFQIRYVLC